MRKRLLSAWKVPLGLLLLVVGGILALPLVPGPGIAVMLVGVALLSERFSWAGKIHARVKEAADRLRRRR